METICRDILDHPYSCDTDKLAFDLSNAHLINRNMIIFTPSNFYTLSVKFVLLRLLSNFVNQSKQKQTIFVLS